MHDVSSAREGSVLYRSSPDLSSEAARQVMTKAVLRVADRLAISQAELAQILGVSPSTVSRMAAHPISKPKVMELAALLVRLYRSLIGIVEQDESARQWFRSDNHYLGSQPATLVQSVAGLMRTLTYLDAMRARV